MILDNFIQWLVVNTLFPEMTNHHNHEDGFKGDMRIGPVSEVTTSYMYGKHGIEIRIWSLSEDNSQSWVRISYGTNKYVIDSNLNNTEVPADLPEEEASQVIVKDFAARSKAKAKPRKREPVDVPRIILMNEKKWIDIEPGDSSLFACEILTLSNSTTRRRRSSSILMDQEISSKSFSTSTTFSARQPDRHGKSALLRRRRE